MIGKRPYESEVKKRTQVGDDAGHRWIFVDGTRDWVRLEERRPEITVGYRMADM